MALSFIQCKSDDDANDVGCIEIFAPVCGADGIVYSNSCYAERAGVEYTDGYCPEERNGVILDLGDPALDGCDWAIQFEIDGELTNFRPNNLSDDFKIDGQQVEVNYTLQLESAPCGINNQIQVIEINSISIR